MKGIRISFVVIDDRRFLFSPWLCGNGPIGQIREENRHPHRQSF